MRPSFLAALGMTIAAALNAQTPNPRDVQPERPTVATHAFTVAPGYLEIEAGGETDHASGAVTNFVPATFKFGLASHAQLSLFSTIDRLSTADIGVGVKWRLMDDAPILGAFAILPSVTIPTSSSTSVTGYSLLLISSHKFGDVSMDVNAGLTERAGNGTILPKSATLWTASFGGPFTERYGWCAEVYGYPGTGGPQGEKGLAAFLAGPTMLVRNYLAVDAGVIVPIAGPQPRALYAGAVYNVGKLW